MFEPLFARLSRSAFRSRFHLQEKDLHYIRARGLPQIRRHAGQLIAERLAPADPPNDGRQTPMRGHPVFIAQHATATCCRGCLYKWHRIPAGSELTKAQQDYVVNVIMAWIEREMENAGMKPEEDPNAWDVSRFSTVFRVRPLTVQDIPQILQLCRGNPLYYEHLHQQPEESGIRADLTALPPHKTMADKFYLGYFQGRTLIAVMDLIRGYPQKDTAFLGFFMMNAACQGQGIGTSILSELAGQLKWLGFRRLRLGYVADNPQSGAFWKKNGFEPCGKSVPWNENPQIRMVVAQRDLD